MTRRVLVPLAVVVVALLGGAVFFVWPAMKHESPSTPSEIRAAELSETSPKSSAHPNEPRSQPRESGQSSKALPPPGPDTVDSCMKREQMASASGATTLLVYDHEIGAPITMDLLTWCQETIALSPAPGGDLDATFSVSGGHVRADYYLVERSSVPRPNGSTPISLPAEVKISDEEAQAILAEQTRQGRR